MCLLKKKNSPPDHRVNKKPRTPPLDNLLQRGYLEGIGWLPMAMLLEPVNGSTMVGHVLDVTFQPMARWVYHIFPVIICNLIKEPALYKPITKDIVDGVTHELTLHDVENDPNRITKSTCIVTSNVDRAIINAEAIKAFGKHNNTPILQWRRKLSLDFPLSNII
jgi:hypothetical protein